SCHVSLYLFVLASRSYFFSVLLLCLFFFFFFFFSSRRRHTRFKCDWSSDVCSSDLLSAALVHAPTAFVPAPTVRAPIPIASLAAAILRFLCVAVHSLGAHHAIAVEAARSCVSTREGLRKA